MFGIGFTELLLISVIGILFLGPDKLPEAMIQIAKFIKSIKKTVGEAKSSLNEEMRVGDLKEEALNYKKQLDSATSELKSFKNIDFDDIMDHDDKDKKNNTVKKESTYTEDKPTTQVEAKSDAVTFKKKPKKKQEAKTEAKELTDKTKGDA